MNKKLESRIAYLEKLLLNKKYVKNEGTSDKNLDAVAEAIYSSANDIQRACQSLAAVIQAAKEVNLPEVENALSLCEDDFPQRWVEKYNRILSRK